MAATKGRAIRVNELSDAAVGEVAAAECLQHLQIDFAEFEKRWRVGEYRNDPNPDVTRLAMMLNDAWRNSD
jgi:hypothetical protein